MKKFSKKTISLAAGALLVLGTGTAYAYWTTTGAGTGTALTGTSTAITVNQTSTTANLYPGTSVDLSGDFDNPGTSAQYVTAVTATGYSIDAAHVTAGCTIAQGNYTLGGTSTVPGSVDVGSGVGTWSGLTITMNNLSTNQDACKNATLTITYASS